MFSLSELTNVDWKSFVSDNRSTTRFAVSAKRVFELKILEIVWKLFENDDLKDVLENVQREIELVKDSKTNLSVYTSVTLLDSKHPNYMKWHTTKYLLGGQEKDYFIKNKEF